MEMERQVVDEISLIDIALILKKRKKLFLGVVALFTCVAVIFSAVKTTHHKFTFTQNFQFAHYYDGSVLEPLIPVDELVVAINTQIAPTELSQFSRKNNMHLTAKPLEVSQNTFPQVNNKDTFFSPSIFSLSIESDKNTLPTLQHLFANIKQQINQYEGVTVANFKNWKHSQLTLYQQSVMILRRKLASLNKVQTLAYASGKLASTHVAVAGSEPGVDIQNFMSYQQLLANKASIQSQIQQMRLAMLNQQHAIDTLTLAKAVGDIQVSAAGGISKTVAFALVFLLGIFMALVAVFIAEFFQKLKQQDVL